MHVSSTEPAAFHHLGTLTTLPEKYGVDFLWVADGKGWCGVQRKEVKDLIASMHDGRLAREVKQMQQLALKLLVVEGRVDMVGNAITVPRTRTSESLALYAATLWSLQADGCMVIHSTDVEHTAMVVAMFEAWTNKSTHTALTQTRGKVNGDRWGRVGSRDFGVHLLTGVPGVGVELAGRIYDHFDGVPWRWECDEEELCKVPGIGKVRAKRMMEALSGQPG